MDVLTGAIDAALGVDKAVKASTHVAAGYAAIAEVEGRRLRLRNA